MTFFEKLFGKKVQSSVEVESGTNGPSDVLVQPDQPIGRTGGIFTKFIGSLQNIFDPDTPFLTKLFDIFDGAKDAFGNIFSGILKGIGNIIPGMSGIGGTLGSFATMLFGTGGIAYGGIRAMANGGVIAQPTLAMVGEGRYNEAVVPLPDGKSIPVSVMGGSAQNNNVTVNVSVDNQGNASQTITGDQAGNLGNAIARAVQKELQNQKRSGGILNPYGVA